VGRWLAAPLGLFAVVVSCGCASAVAKSHPAHRPATTEELRWIGRLDRWYSYDLFPVDCAMRLASLVGGAPTRRLQPYYTRSAAACTSFERWQDARSEGKRALARRESNQGLATIRRVDRALNPLRPGMRRLPRRRGAGSASRINPRYGYVAAVLSVSARVRVRCWSLTDWDSVTHRYAAYTGRPGSDLLGFVIQPMDVNLSPIACRALDEFTFSRTRPTDRAGLDELAEGINALAHESEHIANPGDSERVVECNGMQSIPHATKLLGGSERYGLRLARAYYRDLYPHMPANYWTLACRDGGSLDWDPWGHDWP
jgi:hypothetical protein